MNDTIHLPDETTCWQAVQERDGQYDGVVYYGVRSTGVYCRPSCPSRRPRREQVTFFPSWQAAEEAGFRACRRCHPREAGERGTPAVELTKQARRLLENAEMPLTLDELGAQLGVSPYYLQRTFKAVTGLTPRQYAAALRAQQFKTQVRSGQEVSGALYEAGYSSSSRLYEHAAGYLGMTPAVYRKGGAGMSIYYTIIDCRLGCLLVAATEQGICAVAFEDTPHRLRDGLAKEFPAAEIIQTSAAAEGDMAARLAGWAAALREYVDGAPRELDLPLDIQGTAFQKRVWDELRRIPLGQTHTYAQVAQSLGQPSAVRAVARACATNPAALVVPCHRVVRSDGSLAGYRWGISRKRTLLEQERQAVAHQRT